MSIYLTPARVLVVLIALLSVVKAGGRLELRVWHERARRGLRANDLTRGHLVIDLKADEVKDVGDIVVTVDAFD